MRAQMLVFSITQFLTLFFLIYINDLFKSTMFDVFMYADDTTLISDLSDIPLENQAKVLNLELEKVSNWLACNKLSLNTYKTKFVFP